MAHGIPRPQSYDLPILFPVPPLHTFASISEVASARASEKYPIEVADTPNLEVLRRKYVKLLQARYGKVDASWLDMITGTIPRAQRSEMSAEINKWATRALTEWIGASSWVQKWMIGEVAYHDYQVLIDSHNRAIRLLRIPIYYETAAQTEARIRLREEYENALQHFVGHIQDSASRRIQDLEDQMKPLGDEKFNHTKAGVLRRQIDAIKVYVEGLTPTHDFAVERIEDVEREPLYYAQMDSGARAAFWRNRWSIDVMVSWLWQFSTVLHFKANWDNNINQMMFRDRLVYLADIVFQKILAPRNLNSPRDYISASATLRTDLALPGMKSEIVTQFIVADEALWPEGCENAPGDHTNLFVEGEPLTLRRTKRKQPPHRGDDKKLAAAIRRLG